MSGFASELHPLVDPSAQRVCVGCDCTDATPCIDAAGDACSWFPEADMDICTICAAIAIMMAEADERDVAERSAEARIEIYSPGEAQRFIESRRSASAGGAA